MPEITQESVNRLDPTACTAQVLERAGAPEPKETKMSETTVRASAADLLLACASSAQKPEIRIDRLNEAANVGMAVHEATQRCLTADVEPSVSAIQSAHQFDVADTDEVEQLTRSTLDGIRSVKEVIKHPQVEVEIPSKLFRNRCDVLVVLPTPGGPPTHISIWDIKTTRDQSATYPGQMMAYASAAREHYGMPSSGYIYTGEVMSRHGHINERRVTSERIDGFEERIRRQLSLAGKYRTVGPHCNNCKRQHECGAWLQYVQTACAAFVGIDVMSLSPDQIGIFWDLRCEMKAALDSYDRVVDSVLAGGPIRIDDKRQLKLVAKQVEKVRSRQAMVVMRKFGLTNDDIGEILSVRKTKLYKLAANRATDRKKAETCRRLMEALKSADAIETTTRWERKVTEKGDATHGQNP